MCDKGMLTTDSQEGMCKHVRGEAMDEDHWRAAIEATPELPTEEATGDDAYAHPEHMKRICQEYVRRGGRTGDGRTLEKAYVNGFMQRDAAMKVVAAFNMLTDKAAWIVTRQKAAAKGRRPMAFSPVTSTAFDDGTFHIHTRQWYVMTDSEFAWMRGDAGMCDDARDLEYVTFVDPKAGRGARKGLFADIIRVLRLQ